MKKFIFLTLGTKGDLYPFLGLATALQRQGRKTIILASEPHRADCEAEGCEFASIQSSADYHAMLTHPDVMRPLKGLSVYLAHGVAPATEAAYRLIERNSLREPCALVFNNLMFAGLLAHEKLRLPAASVFLHPFSHMSLVDPPRDTPFNTFFMRLIGRRARKEVVSYFHTLYNRDLKSVSELRARLGLAPVSNMMGEWRHQAPLMIDLWPEWYGPPKSDWVGTSVRTGFIAYDGPVFPSARDPLGVADLSAYLQRGPVIFTTGTGHLFGLKGETARNMKVSRELGLPGLMVATQELAATWPRDEMFRVIGPAPFARLFPHATAVVSHGGIGTVARAMMAGKPQVLTPMVNDQFDNAYQVERLNIGRSVPHAHLTVGRLTRALQNVGAPEIRANCQRVAADMAHNPGLERTCELLIRALDPDSLRRSAG